MGSNTQATSRAILFSVIAFAAFAISDGMRKILTVEYDVLDILFWQSSLGILFILIFGLLAKNGGRFFVREVFHLQVARGLLMAANTALSLWAISKMPIVDAYTIYFLTPFVVSLMGAFFFKEKIGVYRLSVRRLSAARAFSYLPENAV